MGSCTFVGRDSGSGVISHDRVDVSVVTRLVGIWELQQPRQWEERGARGRETLGRLREQQEPPQEPAGEQACWSYPSERTVALEPGNHGRDRGVCIAHELLQGVELGEHLAPLVDPSTSWGCPCHRYPRERFAMRDRGAQPVHRTHRVDGGQGQEFLLLDLLESVAES